MLQGLHILLQDECGLLHLRQAETWQGAGEGSRGGCLRSRSWAAQGQMLQQGACHGSGDEGS